MKRCLILCNSNHYTKQMDAIANKFAPLRTGEQVRDEFMRRGLSISEWARARGYSAQLVYQVLAGRKRCLRGQSHAIAVTLGLKEGLVGSINDIDGTVSAPLGAITSEAGEQIANN
jgi:gp16 family phage-associated protein